MSKGEGTVIGPIQQAKLALVVTQEQKKVDRLRFPYNGES
jgi:hypothetical protein